MASCLQSIYEVYAHQKADLLLHLVKRNEDWSNTIIFLRSRDELHELTTALKHEGIAADSISGNKKPELRERALNELKSGTIRILLATEAILRDADLTGICRIIQFDFHELEQDYLSRVEICSKEVTTFVTQDDAKHLAKLAALTNDKLEKKRAEDFPYAYQPRKIKAKHAKGCGPNKTGSKPLQHKKPKLKSKGPRRKTGRTRKR
ncbi:MAG: helicase-related protein [Akkermansiaceae bacterium]